MELLTDNRKYIKIMISFLIIIFLLGFRSGNTKAHTIDEVIHSVPVSLLEASTNEASIENYTLGQNELEQWNEYEKEEENSNSENEVKLDKDNLPDGKYTVVVNLWHAVSDKASMGNLALNHEALITVKKEKYIMELATYPMTVGTITACLQTLEIKQEDNHYKTAKITARNNLGGQPSIFLFSMPHKNNFIEVKIDPKVEVMGNDPLPARLKIDWDTLKQVPDTTKIEMISKPTDTVSQSKAVNLIDKETKIKIIAEENVLPDDVIFDCKKISSGSKISSAEKALNKENKLRYLYEINLYSSKKESIQPNGMIQIYFPMKKKYEGKKIVIYRVENGNLIKMTAVKKGTYYLFSTNQVGQFAVTEELQNQTISSNSIALKKKGNELEINKNFTNENSFNISEDIENIGVPEIEKQSVNEGMEQEKDKEEIVQTEEIQENPINETDGTEQIDQLEYSTLQSGEQKEDNLNFTKHILFLSIAGSFFFTGVMILVFFRFIKKGLR